MLPLGLLLSAMIFLAALTPPSPSPSHQAATFVPVPEAPGPTGGGCPQPAGPDLDVTFINRTPLYNAYCVRYSGNVADQPGIPYLCPVAENDRRWPEPGEIVTFTAHIIKGTQPSPAFGCAWHIDGDKAGTGALPSLSRAAAARSTYPWPWAMGSHQTDNARWESTRFASARTGRAETATMHLGWSVPTMT
jgi:hypothetical protein